MTWICIKCQIALATQELVYPEKPFSTAGCTYEFEPLITPANATFVDTRQVRGIFLRFDGCLINVTAIFTVLKLLLSTSIKCPSSSMRPLDVLCQSSWRH